MHNITIPVDRSCLPIPPTPSTFASCCPYAPPTLLFSTKLYPISSTRLFFSDGGAHNDRDWYIWHFGHRAFLVVLCFLARPPYMRCRMLTAHVTPVHHLRHHYQIYRTLVAVLAHARLRAPDSILEGTSVDWATSMGRTQTQQAARA
jgi:hypothetical protein